MNSFCTQHRLPGFGFDGKFFTCRFAELSPRFGEGKPLTDLCKTSPKSQLLHQTVLSYSKKISWLQKNQLKMAPPRVNSVFFLIWVWTGKVHEGNILPHGPFHGAPMEVREVFCMSWMQEGTENLLCSDGICIADWRGEFCPKGQISSFRAKLFLFYTSAENYHLGNTELRNLKVKNTSNCPAILQSNLQILFSKLFFKLFLFPHMFLRVAVVTQGIYIYFLANFQNYLGNLS